jgi:hypothetical protein
MKDQILGHVNNPGELEKLYRSNKSLFKREFNTLYPEIQGSQWAVFWNERLNYERDEINWATGRELVFVLIAVLFAGLTAKLPAIFHIDEEYFFTRNAGFVIFPALSAYFAWKNKLSIPKIAFVAGLALVGLLFINWLPDNKKSDTLILSCIYMAFFLWSLLGFVFVGGRDNNAEKRLGFLSYNGDLVVMSALIAIAGAILSGVTAGLFKLIGFNIEKLYTDFILPFGLPAIPIIGTYLTQTNPNLVGKVSPVIAKIFCPLVLGMLIIYLIAIVVSGKDLYNDREFLMVFNALLIGVMAIIFFSVATSSKATNSRMEIWTLALLSTVTVIVNGFALSAILFRISEWGVTANRAAVLGSNVLILINLLLVTVLLFKVLFKKKEITLVGKVITYYLPVYFIWSVIVIFLFPFLFGFK